MPNTNSSPWTFHIVTLGCKVNQYESQALREAWQQLGGVEVAQAAAAQISVVNSCAITARAERETRNALYRLTRENPQGQRILTGCAALLVQSTLRDKPSQEIFAHAILGAKQKSLLLQGPWRILQDTLPAPEACPPYPPYPPFRIAAFHRTRPVLKVQDGCSHRCTYCIVPIARGPAVSRPPQEVLDEARRLLQAGHREIMLSGINLSQYGRNTSNAQDYGNFWNLLDLLERELAPEWAGTARFRISSLEPGQLNAHGLESLSRCTILCPHVHISLQSGSYPVLRRMGRGHYRPEQLLDAIRALQQQWPRMGFGADILTGFPGEKAEHFAESQHLIAELPLTYAHVFPYSRRPHTAAADFPDQVPHHEKLARAAQIRALVSQKQKAFLHSLLKLELTHVVLDGAQGSKGINEFYAPCRLKELIKKDRAQGIVQAKPVRVDTEKKELVLVVEEIGEDL